MRTLTSPSKDKKKEGIALFLTNDLSFLRFIETFAESAPQLTLMIAFIERREVVDWVTGTSTVFLNNPEISDIYLLGFYKVHLESVRHCEVVEDFYLSELSEKIYCQ